MPLILPGNVASAVSGAYEVANSCRFNSVDDACMHKAFGTPTSVDKWTISFWVKRGNLSDNGDDDYQNIWGTITNDGTSNVDSRFNSTDDMRFTFWQGGATVAKLNTNAKFRDPSAWYHMVQVWDSGNATAGDRMKWYVNGVEVTAFSTDTNPSQDLDSYWNSSGSLATIGSFRAPTPGSDGTGSSGDYYLAEVVFCDGQAYAASDFGEFDDDSPTIWKPKDVSGLTFGNNGFYLDFEASDNLGNDANGGTDFTLINMAAADQSTDSPTNNFATLNLLDNYYQAATFSEGNCKVVTGGSSVYAPTFSTLGMTAGKWYCEVMPAARGNGVDEFVIGVASTQVIEADETLGRASAHDWGYYGDNGQKYNVGTHGSYGDAYTLNDKMGIALDLDNNKLYFAKNNTWQDSGDPTSGATGTGAISITAASSTPLGAYFFAFAYYGNDAGTMAVNFGGCPSFAITSAANDANGYGTFEYAPPSGYLSLCTKNLGSDGG